MPLRILKGLGSNTLVATPLAPRPLYAHQDQDNNVKRDFVLISIFYILLAVDMCVFHRNI